MKGYSTINEEKNTGSGEEICATNLMDKFPELNLRPSSLLQEIKGDSKSFYRKRIKVLIPISFILLFSPLIIFYSIEGKIQYIEEWLSMLFVGVCLCFLIILACIATWRDKIIYSDIKKKFDYYQDNTKNKKDTKSAPYLIVVKGNKFGVLKMGKESSVQIQQSYDYLSWRESGKLLNAKSNGESFIIDISGARLP